MRVAASAAPQRGRKSSNWFGLVWWAFLLTRVYGHLSLCRNPNRGIVSWCEAQGDIGVARLRLFLSLSVSLCLSLVLFLHRRRAHGSEHCSAMSPFLWGQSNIFFCFQLCDAAKGAKPRTHKNLRGQETTVHHTHRRGESGKKCRNLAALQKNSTGNLSDNLGLNHASGIKSRVVWRHMQKGKTRNLEI